MQLSSKLDWLNKDVIQSLWSSLTWEEWWPLFLQPESRQDFLEVLCLFVLYNILNLKDCMIDFRRGIHYTINPPMWLTTKNIKHEIHKFYYKQEPFITGKANKSRSPFFTGKAEYFIFYRKSQRKVVPKRSLPKTLKFCEK